jgi:hypothetical protein
MEVGKRYHIEYEEPGGKGTPREAVMDFLGEGAFGTYDFSGRPFFGTVPISKKWITYLEEVAADTSIYVNWRRRP